MDAQLGEARKVLAQVMRHKTAKLLFNVPVDPVALGLPDYAKLIKRPMDLGTIARRLESGQYQSPEQVKKDVAQVWKNCITYNKHPEDEPTRDACREVQELFDSLWSEAGLDAALLSPQKEDRKGSKQKAASILVGERAVPEQYSLAQGEGELPVRLLSYFSIAAAADPSKLVPLKGKSKAPVVVSGTLLAPEDNQPKSKKRQVHTIQTGPIVDWCFQYGDSPGIWVITDTAWYKLVTPAEEYAEIHEAMAHRLQLCNQAMLEMEQDPDMDLSEAVDRAFADLAVPGKPAIKLRQFVEMQLQTWVKEGLNEDSEEEEEPSASGRGGDGSDAGAGEEEAGPSRRSRKSAVEQQEPVGRRGKRKALDMGDNEDTPTERASKRPKVVLRFGKHEKPAKQEESPPGMKVKLGRANGVASPGASKKRGQVVDAEGPAEVDPEDSGRQRTGRKKRSARGAGELAEDAQNDEEEAWKPDADGLTARQRSKAEEDKRAAELAAQQAAEARLPKVKGPGRAKREREADAARGPVPPPSRAFRAPAGLIPDLITVWELLQTLGGLLQITPFPLWRLEAALCPGPFPPAQPPAAPEAAGKEIADEAAEVPVEEPAEEPEAPAEAANVESTEGPETSAAEEAAALLESIIRTRHQRDGGLEMTEGKADDAKIEKRRGRKKKKKRKGPKVVLHTAKAKQKTAKPMKLRLKIGASGAQIAVKKAPDAPKEPQALDREGAASAIVLREVHCALLRAIEGAPLTPDQSAPLSARLFSPDSQGGQYPWTERAANAILSAQEAVPPEAWDAAAQLAYDDYWTLTSEQRVAILKGLAELALNVEAVRDHAQALAEAALAPRLRPPVESGEQEVGSPAATVPLAGSVEEWERWKEEVRVNSRKPLGMDMQRRRYWAIGGRGCAWRIYVEEDEGLTWGWYEGEGLLRLVAWLKEGAIDREGALRRALSKLPLPRRFVPAALSRPAAGQPLALPSTATSLLAGDEGAAQEMVSEQEMVSRRLDGMRGILAPQLRGEGNWPKLGLYSSYETRIFYCVDALLSDVPFWFKGQDWLVRHCAACDAVAAAKTAAAMGPALLAVEDILFTNGCMDEAWEESWKAMWRKNVLASLDLKESLLYVTTLQEHVRRKPGVLPRTAFAKIAKESNCQLYFPAPGEHIVVLRTGILQHLHKHMQCLGLKAATLPPPASPQEPSSSPAKEEGAALLGTATEDVAIRGDVRAASNQSNPSEMLQLPESEGATALPATEGQEPTRSQELASGSPEPAFEEKQREPLEPVDMETGTGTPDAAGVAKSAAGKADDPMPDADEPADEVGAGEAAQMIEDEGVPGEDVEEAEAGKSNASDSRPQSREASMSRGEPGSPKEELPPEVEAELGAQWEALKAKVEALRHVERYKVASISYRRNLFEGSAAEVLSKAADPEAQDGRDAARWPCAWLLLRPARAGPAHQLPEEEIALPLRIDLALPDFLAKAHEFDEALRRQWSAGDRFQMFFGGKSKNRFSRAGGVYYKGTVVSVKQAPPPTAPQQELEAYDPWEAVRVEWDASRGHAVGECENVSPWELQLDPEDSVRIAEEQRRQQETAARAARAEAAHYGGKPILGPRVREGEDWVAAGRDESDQEWEPTGDTPQSSGGGDWRPSRSERAARRESQIAESGSTIVSKDVLDSLQPLSRDRFTVLLGNWYRINRGKFKVPIFAHQELDLHRVFWEVQARGGSDVVTAEKMWKDVCRSLGVDLTGQTSASYNMRLNYEKCLLEFEHYLASGEYAAELAAGAAPSPDVVQHAHKPQALGSAGPPAGADGVTTRSTRETRRSDCRHAQRSVTPNLSGGAEVDAGGGFSFTKLLGLEDEGMRGGGLIPPPPLVGSVRMPYRGSPSWRRLVAPAGVAPSQPSTGQGWVAAVHGVSPVMQDGDPYIQQSAQGLPHPFDPSMDPMQAISAALQGGHSVEELHRLVDEAAAQLSLLPSPSVSEPQRLTGPVSEASADLVIRASRDPRMQAIERPATDAADRLPQTEGEGSGKPEPAARSDGVQTADRQSPVLEGDLALDHGDQGALQGGSRETSAAVEAQPECAKGTFVGSTSGGTHLEQEPDEVAAPGGAGPAGVETDLEHADRTHSCQAELPGNQTAVVPGASAPSGDGVLDISARTLRELSPPEPTLASQENNASAENPAEPVDILALDAAADGQSVDGEKSGPAGESITAHIWLNGQNSSLGSQSNSATTGLSREGTPAAHKPIRLKLKIAGKPL